MKVLLQNKRTRLFVQEAGTWTINIEEGFGFINSDKAIDFAFEQKLTNVHLVLWFREQNYCITLPLQTEDPDTGGASLPEVKPGDRDRL